MLDNNDLESLKQCVVDVKEAFGAPISILVNNAGGHYDRGEKCETVSGADFLDALNVNFIGCVELTRLVIPVSDLSTSSSSIISFSPRQDMKAQNFGRIVNISSRSGSFSDSWKNAPG